MYVLHVFLQSMLIPGLNSIQLTFVVVSNLLFSIIKRYCCIMCRDKTAEKHKHFNQDLLLTSVHTVSVGVLLVLLPHPTTSESLMDSSVVVVT